MPETIQLTPGTVQNVQASAFAGKSIYDQSLENMPAPAAPPPAKPPEGAILSDPNPRLPMDDLKAAQAKDKGLPEPAKTLASAAKPAAADDTPEWVPKDEKRRGQWNQIKTRAEAAEKERDTLKAEIERVKNEIKTADPEDLKALREERDRYQKELREVAIERDPAFKQKYETKRNSAVSQAKAAAGEVGEKLEKLINLPPSPHRDTQIEKAIEDLPLSAQRRINAALGIIESIDIDRQTEIDTAIATYDTNQKTRAEAQKRLEAQTRASYEKAFADEQKSWLEKSPLFQMKDGDTEHNNGVQQRLDMAKNIFSGQLNPQELSRAAHWAAVGPDLVQSLINTQKIAQDYKTRLEKIMGVSPNGSESSAAAPQSQAEPGTTEYRGSFMSGIAQAQLADRGAR